MFRTSRPISFATMKFSRTSLMRHGRMGILALLTASLILAGSSKAQTTLSPTSAPFNKDGVVTTDFFNGSNDEPTSVVRMRNGKIIVAGLSSSGNVRDNFALARYNSDGSLDNSFGDGGKVVTDFFGLVDFATKVLLQPDGKIVVAGTTTNDDSMLTTDFAVVRYNSDGSLDTTFDHDGRQTTDFFGSYDYAWAAVLQPDGKIVLGGHAAMDSPFGSHFALARYNTDGSLDTTFDSDGKLVTQFSSVFERPDAVQDLAIHDGKILAAGYMTNTDNPGHLHFDFAVARYNLDGSLDGSFSDDGKQSTDFFGDGDTARSIALQADGKIVVGGHANAKSIRPSPSSTENLDFALARYNTDGTLDPGFNGNGKQATDFFLGWDYIVAVTIEAGDKILVSGAVGLNEAPYSVFGLARYFKNGRLDTTFNKDGKLITFFPENFSAVTAGHMVLPNGEIVAAGKIYRDGFAHDFALVRYTRARISSTPTVHSVVLPGGSSVPGCASLTGYVLLNDADPTSPTIVTLTDTLDGVAVPSRIVVPAGHNRSGDFTIRTKPVNTLQMGEIIATINSSTKSAPLKLLPVRAKALSLEPNPVTGPNIVTGTVLLECPAPEGGLTVSLSSNNPTVAAPTTNSIIIPAGSTRKEFTIQTRDVPVSRTAIIKVTVNGRNLTSALTVN